MDNLKDMKQFIKETLSNKDNISSKRILGAFLILVFISIMYISIWKPITELTKDMADTTIWVAVIMFGGTVLEKFKK